MAFRSAHLGTITVRYIFLRSGTWHDRARARQSVDDTLIPVFIDSVRFHETPYEAVMRVLWQQRVMVGLEALAGAVRNRYACYIVLSKVRAPR